MAEETKDTAPQAEPQEREEAPAQEAEQTAPEKSEAELLREQVDSLNDKLLRTMIANTKKYLPDGWNSK